MLGVSRAIAAHASRKIIQSNLKSPRHLVLRLLLGSLCWRAIHTRGIRELSRGGVSCMENARSDRPTDPRRLPPTIRLLVRGLTTWGHIKACTVKVRHQFCNWSNSSSSFYHNEGFRKFPRLTTLTSLVFSVFY